VTGVDRIVSPALSRPRRPAYAARVNAKEATAYVRRHLPWLALPLAPAQGLWVTRRVPRLAEAEGRDGVVGEGDRRLHVVAVGDSVTAGYAVAHHRSTVAGGLAARLAQRYGARVTCWILRCWPKPT
jgi:hypothetical protein